MKGVTWSTNKGKQGDPPVVITLNPAAVDLFNHYGIFEAMGIDFIRASKIKLEDESMQYTFETISEENMLMVKEMCYMLGFDSLQNYN